MRLDIEIASDAICPWCFIGNRRLEWALHALAGQCEYWMAWRPFELSPTMPPEGMDWRRTTATSSVHGKHCRNWMRRWLPSAPRKGLIFGTI